MQHAEDEMSELDRLVAAELLARRQRLDWLGTGSSLLLVVLAVWLAWPAMDDPGSINILGLGPAILLVGWAVAVQDATTLTARSRARIGAATAVAWPPVLVLAGWMLDGGTPHLLGALTMTVVAAALWWTSRQLLAGQDDAVRFRGLMTGAGGVVALSFIVGGGPTGVGLAAAISVLGLATAVALLDWFGSDHERSKRRVFKGRLNALEQKLLELRAEGAPLDQASSLVKSAAELGWRDPDHGMELLDEAEHDMERQLRMSEDLEIIRDEALERLDEAEAIAPAAIKPRRSYDQGLREQDLGSLREAELLFRRSKTLSTEIIAWWGPMEEAIKEAEKHMRATDPPEPTLVGLVEEARRLRDQEAAKEATEVARAVLTQSEALGAQSEKADERVADAKRALATGADGLDDSEWLDRFEQANRALASGDHSQAQGLADSIVREIAAEREAMEAVRRALRQRKKLQERFQPLADREAWQARLSAVEDMADAKTWRLATAALAALTSELDEVATRIAEAAELVSFVQDEWSPLRRRLESAGVTVKDPERRACETTIAEAGKALDEGRLEDTLSLLGEADTQMEALRRRV